jgi:hypothetical protein
VNMETMNAPKGMTALDSGVEDGVEWATVVAPLYGAVNGYVRVPEGHPWGGLDVDDIDVEVHGGLTYAREGWIGFDTLHGWDFWPGCPTYWQHDGAKQWTPELVADEARDLARRVASAGVSS